MILDLLDAIEAQGLDDTYGWNALIDEYNSNYSENVEALATIDVWELNKLPADMTMPALMVEWAGSPNLEPESQNKWRGEHDIRFWYWINAVTTRENRRHLAGMYYVIRKFIDRLLIDQDPAVTVQSLSMDVFGFRTGPDQLFAVLRTECTMTERYENP